MFYISEKDSLSISYTQLFEDINNLSRLNSCKRHNRTYDFYVNLIAGIINNIDIVIFDNNITNVEYEALIKSNNLEKISSQNNSIKINSTNFLKELIICSDSKLTLFTSGTTGTPKRITHKLSSLIQNVKTDDHYINNIWGLAYNPTHIAGIQVFLQAILNSNTIIDIYNMSRGLILDSFSKYKITNLSATPTFYRLLFPLNSEFKLLKQITVGGEKSDKNLINKLNKYFKNARITNIYASTEAGQILKSKGDFFKIENEFVKIVNNEILIHKSLLGNNDFSTSEWYQTGDLVKYIDENKVNFKIVSRKNDLINSGGYMINLTEVEEVIMQIDGISDARVYSRNNAVIGNIILCEIELLTDSILSEEDINTQLKNRLQTHKIPRIIKIVESIKKTNTGKKIR